MRERVPAVPGADRGLDGPITFIVRISIDEEGDVTAVVERVRTGQKERVHRVDDIGRVIAMMIAARGEAL